MFKIRLKELRESKGMTQRDFAIDFGVSKGTVGMWESGAREPKTLSEFNRIADYFGVSSDYLLGRTDNKKKSILSPEDGLSAEEQPLMNLVRKLTPDQHKFLVAWLKTALEQEP